MAEKKPIETVVSKTKIKNLAKAAIETLEDILEDGTPTAQIKAAEKIFELYQLVFYEEEEEGIEPVFKVMLPDKDE